MEGLLVFLLLISFVANIELNCKLNEVFNAEEQNAKNIAGWRIL